VRRRGHGCTLDTASQSATMLCESLILLHFL
jgi:hypothetical protein